MKRVCLILLALLVLTPACKYTGGSDDESSNEEAEKSKNADQAATPDKPDKVETVGKKAPKPPPSASTDDSNEPGGFRSATEIALRELPFEPCLQVHKAPGADKHLRSFEHTYEGGRLMSKLDLSADGTVVAAWAYAYDDDGRRIRAMRDDVPDGREMKEPELIISYTWKGAKLVKSGWVFANDPDKTFWNRFTYNDQGQLVRVVSDGFPTDPPLDDNKPRIWTLQYDKKGYLVRRERRPKDGEALSRYTDFSYKDGKLVHQVHRADIQGAWKMQFDAKYAYDADNLAKQALEWGHANYGSEAIAYAYECDG